MLVNTGDRFFFLDMQRTAKKLGMHLDEFGLWRREENGSKSSSSTTARSPSDSGIDHEALPESTSTSKGRWLLLAGETEESIFRELGKPYIEPTKRNFGFLRPENKTPRLRDLPTSRRGRPKTRPDEDVVLERRPRGRPPRKTA